MSLLTRKAKGKGKSKLHEVLGEFELPTIPGVLTAAIEQISGPDADMKKVAATVSRDPGLLARILGIVNSAVYAPRSPIVGADQAVMMLGASHLESLLISIAASRAVSASRVPGLDLAEFWNVAAWRGSAAASLARRFDRTRRTENFTGALLQDIAVPLLARNVSGYPQLLERWRAGEATLGDLEESKYGWTHADVAGWVFEEWGFPAVLMTAVAQHNRPEGTEVEFPIVRLVGVLGRPSLGDEAVPILARKIESALGMPADEATELLMEAFGEAGKIASSMR